MTPDALITELDNLAEHQRRVARDMVTGPHPIPNDVADHAIELYGAAAMIDEWIAGLTEVRDGR